MVLTVFAILCDKFCPDCVSGGVIDHPLVLFERVITASWALAIAGKETLLAAHILMATLRASIELIVDRVQRFFHHLSMVQALVIASWIE